MSNKSKKKLWTINTEEQVPVAIVLAETAGGALARFALATKLNREMYTAEKIEFSQNGCSLLPTLPMFELQENQ